jgi:hypothetical protein
MNYIKFGNFQETRKRKAYVERVGEDGVFCISGEIGTSSFCKSMSFVPQIF